MRAEDMTHAISMEMAYTTMGLCALAMVCLTAIVITYMHRKEKQQ